MEQEPQVEQHRPVDLGRPSPINWTRPGGQSRQRPRSRPWWRPAAGPARACPPPRGLVESEDRRPTAPKARRPDRLRSRSRHGPGSSGQALTTRRTANRRRSPCGHGSPPNRPPRAARSGHPTALAVRFDQIPVEAGLGLTPVLAVEVLDDLFSIGGDKSLAAGCAISRSLPVLAPTRVVPAMPKGKRISPASSKSVWKTSIYAGDLWGRARAGA